MNEPIKSECFQYGMSTKSQHGKLPEKMIMAAIHLGIEPTLKIDDYIKYMSAYPEIVYQLQKMEKSGMV